MCYVLPLVIARVSSNNNALRYELPVLWVRSYYHVMGPVPQKPHVRISPNFLYVLPVAVARSSSDGNAIRYVLPVLWMMSCYFGYVRIGLYCIVHHLYFRCSEFVIIFIITIAVMNVVRYVYYSQQHNFMSY